MEYLLDPILTVVLLGVQLFLIGFVIWFITDTIRKKKKTKKLK